MSEKISLAGIARTALVSERQLQDYANEKYESAPREVVVIPKEKGKLTVECDEMWSFVGNKENKQWIWLAIDKDTREIVGVHAGSRDRIGAQSLWDSMPPVYRQCAVSYTDFRSAYEKILPAKRHKAVGKKLEKPIISNGSTIRCVKESLDSSDVHYLFPKKLKIISEQFGISFIITMNHWLRIKNIISMQHYPNCNGGRTRVS